ITGVRPVLAQSPNFSNFSPSPNPNLTLNGSAAQVGTNGAILQLTPNTADQAGSAWFNTALPVSGAFSTTFTFQISGVSAGSLGNADGIAFVIQNSALTALGPDGCGIGYGGSSTGCTSGSGIPNSLAIEFDTYQDIDDPNNNHIAVQSCGTAPNSSDNKNDPTCNLATNSNLGTITLADGNVHSVTITYAPPPAGNGPGSLNVILDNTILFPATGVPVNLSTLLSLANGNAWAGFTAATGGGNDNQDILSWTFTPQAQSTVVSTNGQSTFSYQNAAQTAVYQYTAQLQSGSPVDVQVRPILMAPAACNALVQQNFWPAHCFVYANAENSGTDAAVMFEVTCPQSPGGTCGSNTNQNFYAQLGTVFEFEQSENPFFTYPGIFGLLNPFPGFLKGQGPNPIAPCTPPTTGALFQSNQVSTFFIDNGTTKGNSGGGASCWVATYDTPGETWPGITVGSPAFTTYAQNQLVTANYTCSNPTTSKSATSPTGPYLTVASCAQSELPQAASNTNVCNPVSGTLQCSGPADTSTLGQHTFLVTAIDSGGNTNVQAVVYTVVKHH
ncbi:MAG: L-type lectin-domain containing protein, partial [Terriglobales bacterium]